MLFKYLDFSFRLSSIGSMIIFTEETADTNVNYHDLVGRYVVEYETSAPSGIKARKQRQVNLGMIMLSLTVCGTVNCRVFRPLLWLQSKRLLIAMLHI